VYLLSRALKLRPKPIVIPDARREATHAFWLIVPLTAAVAVWRTFVDTIYTPVFQLSNQHYLNGGQTVDMYDLLVYLLAYSIYFLLLVIVMKRTGQKLASIGVSRTNLGRMIMFGLSLGAVSLFVYGSYSSFQFTGSTSLLYGLVLFTVVGFVEEAIWRGFIQTRLIARFGNLSGLVITSLLFAFLWHFPVAYYTQASENVLGALAFASERFFPGFLFGYVMIKSQNIIPSSILHLFYDWGVILWK
jgi:membrane protease YdiL (CAAX protease family)